MDQKIFKHFQKLIESTMQVGEELADPMAAAADAISSALLAGNRLYSCGDKSGVVLAHLFADYMATGFEIERPGFPAVNINKLADNSFGAERLARSLQVHGQSADVLFVVSGGSNSLALISAIESAIDKGMSVVLLSSVDDDLLSASVSYNDVEISASGFSGRLADAAQFQIIQCLSALIDYQIFGGE
jgi:DnaA initiator-associating protein